MQTVDPSKEIFGEPSVDYSRCGRTDRGVSSIGNVVSLNVRCKGGVGGGGEDEEDDEDGENGEEIDYVGNLNRALPDDVRALCWYAVPDGFSSRFNCTSRRYEYHFTRVVRQNLAPPPRGGEEAGKCEPEEILDVERMREACEKLVGTHDFRNFCKMNVKDCRDYTRHIKECRIEKKNTERTTGALLRETDWVLIIEGSSFCGTWCVASRRCFPSWFASGCAGHYRRASRFNENAAKTVIRDGARTFARFSRVRVRRLCHKSWQEKSIRGGSARLGNARVGGGEDASIESELVGGNRRKGALAGEGRCRYSFS